MIPIQKYYAWVCRFLLLAALSFSVVACGGDGDDGGSTPAKNEAYWKVSSTVASASGSSAIILTGAAGTKWYAQISEGAGWCSFGFTGSTLAKEGTLQSGLNVLYVYYSANTTSDQRQATLSLTFEGDAAQSFTLSQLSSSQDDLPHFTAWNELPEQKESANYVYVAHYAPIGQKTVRNYSLCFDTSKKAALWVAYPLHSVYLGSAGRTDAWAFDPAPTLPESVQANCVMRSYGGNYDRGHQLPSADRLATNELNAQTFYMSNMTPQLNRLNQDMWAKLEAKVRANICSDTLYVVTGAYFGANATTTTDGAGATVPIPTNYFKVLLRTKNGSTGKNVSSLTANDLMAIGFWVEQKSYGNIQPPTSICTTVADIESKTGFKFFSTLSDDVAQAVKAQNNPLSWGIN